MNRLEFQNKDITNLFMGAETPEQIRLYLGEYYVCSYPKITETKALQLASSSSGYNISDGNISDHSYWYWSVTFTIVTGSGKDQMVMFYFYGVNKYTGQVIYTNGMPEGYYKECPNESTARKIVQYEVGRNAQVRTDTAKTPDSSYYYIRAVTNNNGVFSSVKYRVSRTTSVVELM